MEWILSFQSKFFKLYVFICILNMNNLEISHAFSKIKTGKVFSFRFLCLNFFAVNQRKYDCKEVYRPYTYINKLLNIRLQEFFL